MLKPGSCLAYNCKMDYKNVLNYGFENLKYKEWKYICGRNRDGGIYSVCEKAVERYPRGGMSIYYDCVMTELAEPSSEQNNSRLQYRTDP